MKTKHWSIKIDGIRIFQCYISRNSVYFYGAVPPYTKKEGNITRENIRKHISKYINENN